MDYMENFEKRVGYHYESNGEVIHRNIMKFKKAVKMTGDTTSGVCKRRLFKTKAGLKKTSKTNAQRVH